MFGSLKNNNFNFCREKTSLSERPSTTFPTFTTSPHPPHLPHSYLKSILDITTYDYWGQIDFIDILHFFIITFFSYIFVVFFIIKNTKKASTALEL